MMFMEIFISEQKDLKPCKFYDEAGLVMWAGSVTKTGSRI
jgi:hypothetical protein